MKLTQNVNNSSKTMCKVKHSLISNKSNLFGSKFHTLPKDWQFHVYLITMATEILPELHNPII